MEKVRREIDEHRFRLGESVSSPQHITISVGLSPLMRLLNKECDDILKVADGRP